MHGINCSCLMCKAGKKIGLIKEGGDYTLQESEKSEGCSRCGYNCEEHKCPGCGHYHKEGESCA